MLRPAPLCLLLFLAAGNIPLVAQAQADSLALSLNLILDLVEADNYEEAQLEAVQLLDYLHRQHQTCPPEAIPLLSGIYQHNKDKKSALLFFGKVGQDARREPDPAIRARVLEALASAYQAWEQPAEALVCLQQLVEARDTLAEHIRLAATRALQEKIDSLATVQRLEKTEHARYVLLERKQLLALLGGGLAIFLALLLFYWKTTARWRKRLAKKELENEFLRSERFTSTLPAEPVLMAEAKVDIPLADSASSFRPDNHRPEKTALIIEPNRQIVLYIKSLLSDRFEVETASSANEGLLAASNQLPDLIVCDAVLNGKTGIDVVRQIKLSGRTDHIPVILLTERYGNEGKLDALRAGADAWFNRPVLENEFDEQVNRLLEARKAQHETFNRFLHLYFSENRIELSDPFLAKSIQIIDRHLGDPDFLPDDLARKMQLHKQLFTKKLFVLTGKTPVQLIREMRLEKAKALLEKRAGTPQAIADLVGFSSTGSFALAFKEYFGENTLLLQMPGKGN
ncbi:MAG: response regulator transcription factor [Saprospirales bacterium]|nr:response regulator transcription factor [Saprospirales bacterium]